jgi:PKD repeat protein
MILSVLFLSGLMHSQTIGNNVAITWDNNVGCQIVINTGDTHDPKISEEIEEGQCLKVCEFSTVTYSLYGNLINVQDAVWSITGGTVNSTSVSNTIVTWDVSGIGAVQVDITFNDGTTITKSFCVNKINPPVAQFNTIPDILNVDTSLCIKQNIQFNNTSHQNGGSEIVSYYWDFGDNTFSSEQNPIHTYDNSGPYLVQLTVTNSCGCSSKEKLEIYINGPGINISCQNIECEKDKAIYSVNTNQLNGCNNFSWSVEGGHEGSLGHNQSQYEVIWDAVNYTGFGIINLNLLHCDIECPSIVSIKVPIIKKVGTILGETNLCEKKRYRYKLPQWPTTDFQWTLDDGGTGATLILTDQRNEVVVLTSNPGSLILECIYTNTLLKCDGKAVIKMEVNNSLIINGPKIVCQDSNSTYYLVDSFGNPVIGDWTFQGPGGVIFHHTGSQYNVQFETIGTFTLSASGYNFCFNEDFVINVKEKPIAPVGIIGESKVCTARPYTFSVDSPVLGATYEWFITGGVFLGLSFGTEVTVVFLNNQPSYSIQVRSKGAESPFCVSDVFTKTITKINPATTIIAASNSPIVCASSYENYSTNYLEGDTYLWTVEPAEAGSVSSGNGTPNATVLWNNYTGSVTPFLKLKVVKCNSNFITGYNVQIIFAPEIVIQAPSNVCRNTSFNLSVTHLMPNIPVNSFSSVRWDFGDATVYENTTSLNATHIYVDSATSHIVTATIFGANGCLSPTTAVFSINVLDNSKPTVAPTTIDVGCGGINTTPVVVTIPQPITTIDYIDWYYGNTIVHSSAAMSYTPTSIGTYTVVVHYTNGCASQEAYFSIGQNCPTGSCELVGNPVISSMSAALTSCYTGAANVSYTPTPINYGWTYNGPNNATITSQTANNCTLDFVHAGIYRVIFSAEYPAVGGGTCFVTKSKLITVPYVPKIRYNVECNGTTYAVSLISDSEIEVTPQLIEYYIDGTWFNAGTATTYLANLAPGNHIIGIRLSHNSYFTCDTSQTINLQPLPNPTFTVATTTCQGNEIQFIPNDTTPGNQYLWSFGDTSFNFQPSPDKVYENPGSPHYSVTLTITNALGCIATTAVPVLIDVKVNNLNGNITSNNTSSTVCEGTNVVFQYNMEEDTTQPNHYYWYNGQDELVFDSTSPQFLPTISGYYWVMVTDVNGCFTNITSGQSVVFIKPPTPIIKAPTYVCVGNTAKLDGNVGSSPPVTYSWSVNGNSFSNLPVVEYPFFTTGTYVFSLTTSISNGSGGFCSATTQHTITVLDVPLPPVITIDTTSPEFDCNSYTIPLVATASEQGFFSWSNGMSGDTIYVNQGGAYQVTFTNLAGCSSTAELYVPKAPSMFMWIVPHGCYNLCNSPNLSSLIGPMLPMTEWNWQIDNQIVLEGTNSQVSELVVDDSGTYALSFNTGLCNQTSDAFSIDLGECDECNLEVALIAMTILPGEFDGTCKYKFEITINNPTNLFLPSTISVPAAGGSLSPSTFTIQPGSANYTFIFTPPLGFTIGNYSVALTSQLGELFCNTNFDVNFFSCVAESPNPRTTNNFISSTIILKAIPNPIGDKTVVYYDFGSTPYESKRIELYDVLGRLIYSQSIKDSQGELTIDSSGFSAGYFIMVMKGNQEPLAQLKINKN